VIITVRELRNLIREQMMTSQPVGPDGQLPPEPTTKTAAAGSTKTAKPSSGTGTKASTPAKSPAKSKKAPAAPAPATDKLKLEIEFDAGTGGTKGVNKVRERLRRRIRADVKYLYSLEHQARINALPEGERDAASRARYETGSTGGPKLTATEKKRLVNFLKSQVDTVLNPGFYIGLESESDLFKFKM
jgi:hypothetical protein